MESRHDRSRMPEDDFEQGQVGIKRGDSPADCWQYHQDFLRVLSSSRQATKSHQCKDLGLPNLERFQEIPALTVDSESCLNFASTELGVRGSVKMNHLEFPGQPTT